MASTELAFEYLIGATELAHGTEIDIPTHILNVAGKVTPRKAVYRPADSRQRLDEYARSTFVRKWSETEGAGPLDTLNMPWLLESLVRSGITRVLQGTAIMWHAGHAYGAGTFTVPTVDNNFYYSSSGGTAGAGEPVWPVVVGGTVVDNDITWTCVGAPAYLWTYTPDMDADDLASQTLFWGDPAITVWRSVYHMLDTLTIAGDVGGTGGVTMAFKGGAYFPTEHDPDSVPTARAAPLLVPYEMQLWIDSGVDAIGTTAITGRVVGAEFTIASGVTRKWCATGPAGAVNFQSTGRKKRHAELKLTMELPGTTQYDQWVAHTTLKARLRFSGPVIAETLRHYVQLDIYGPFEALEWGELEGSNRTIQLSILSEMQSTTYDFQVVVQNNRNAL